MTSISKGSGGKRPLSVHIFSFQSRPQAYIRRAEALRKALQSGRFEVPANLTYENVIADYCKGHDLKANVKAFVEAILVAVDIGKKMCSSPLCVCMYVYCGDNYGI